MGGSDNEDRTPHLREGPDMQWGVASGFLSKMVCATRSTFTCNCFVPHITHHSFYLFEHKNTPEYTSCTMQLMFTHF